LFLNTLAVTANPNTNAFAIQYFKNHHFILSKFIDERFFKTFVFDLNRLYFTVLNYKILFFLFSIDDEEKFFFLKKTRKSII